MDTVPAKTILTRNKDTSWFGSDYNMNPVSYTHLDVYKRQVKYFI